ncbi:hypothetical protein Dsin_021404 [Dipteronia sinensis]|uniref:Reverse transcriptase domain-containing protein n=1 Tax=Dipteronia sinensis TaxID=43782 RepID=A0AAD9ZZQ9_9ROSI|nr:hypothetical protein Dsin_021404 [Dipteronia sinensis]
MERIKVLSEFWKALRKEEQEWRQKSRVKWLLEGDRNSRFLHIEASGRRRNNYIEDLSFEEVKKSIPGEVKEGVTEFFERHYKNVSWRRPTINDLPLNKLLVVESGSLEETFTKEEVWEAFVSCDDNKALSPDGFNLGFIKANWEVIEGDFMRFIDEFHKDASVVKELNKTFITLIPKCLKPKTVKDFRPISLVEAFYKILAKVLANRMRRVMDKVMEFPKWLL